MDRPDASPTPPGPPAPFRRIVKLTRLNRREPHRFTETASEEETAGVADLLDAISVSKLRVEAALEPAADGGWQLTGSVGATVTQPCVVTLAPVRTRVDQPFRRLYIPGLDRPGTVIDIDPERDEDVEPMPGTLDLGAVAVEELSLALPAYPRAPGAELRGTSEDTAGGDDDAASDADRPFSALAALRTKLEDPGQ